MCYWDDSSLFLEAAAVVGVVVGVACHVLIGVAVLCRIGYWDGETLQHLVAGAGADGVDVVEQLWIVGQHWDGMLLLRIVNYENEFASRVLHWQK